MKMRDRYQNCMKTAKKPLKIDLKGIGDLV
jgi:hypothetical protein